MSFKKSLDLPGNSAQPDSALAKAPKNGESETIEISKPSVNLDSFVRELLCDYPLIEQQTVVHCMVPHNGYLEPKIRIWRSTFLTPRGSSKNCKLLGAYNISYYPDWTKLPPFSTYWFTLIFEGLPKGCTYFDLEEKIPEQGAFYVPNIIRTASDIYYVEV